MRILSWRKALVAAMIAGGMWLPANVEAALLNTNLIIDPGFEDVNTTTGSYGSLQLNSWRDGTEIGFTYASGQYDQGGPLSGGGARYFTTNGGVNMTAAGQFGQLIGDLGVGETGAVIAAGMARYNFGAFFTNYASQDAGVLQLDFRDSADNIILTDLIEAPTSLVTWTEIVDGGFVPVGAESVFVSVWGIANSGGPDGYLDNVNFAITAIPEPSSFAILAIGVAGVAAGRRFRRKSVNLGR